MRDRWRWRLFTTIAVLLVVGTRRSRYRPLEWRHAKVAAVFQPWAMHRPYLTWSWCDERTAYLTLGWGDRTSDAVWYLEIRVPAWLNQVLPG